MEMYLAGVSTRQVDDTGQLLWGRPHALADALRQAQAHLRGDRPMAQQAVGGRMAVRVRGRRVAQAIMGRRVENVSVLGRHRHRHGRPP